MSGSGGVSVARTRGENRFYVSPGIRKQQQLQQQQQQQLKLSISKDSTVEIEKRKGSDQCGSNCSVSGRVGSDTNSTNLDRFLEYTTPVVPAQFLPKTSVGGWRTRGVQHHQNLYFVLGDLWESFKEWSAYGAGVPLLLNGSETVVQYYVPYLSGIQLYIDPLRSSHGLRRPGEESDTESSRETSSDGSSDYGAERVTNNGVWEPWSQLNVTDANIQSLNRLSLRNKPFRGSSSDECEISIPPGRLIFEYMEYASPFTRQPLADQASSLSSIDLKSELSVLFLCFCFPHDSRHLRAVTYHPQVGFQWLAPVQSQNTEWMQRHCSAVREFHHADMSLKLPLPTFGLASYKFKVTFWNLNGVYECQKAGSLVKAADNWLRLLRVNHPDYRFFVSHNTSPR
ncbi:hypothetical protein SADUNF_Sadunf08G0161600 [Salix dunnii]|uniref:Uncharacterized protein n=1 Tax=Salix dunnii TaxID=1413687 RepID=A0A835K3I6_9ROSI|nr:hypothetical protein SADUNF_Sadunf08G0161600 [Salix dunnii]